MSKQTFVFRDGQIVPKASAAPTKGGVSILSDIEPYQNMKDRGWITSRSQHREFLRRNNFVEVGTSQDHLLK